MTAIVELRIRTSIPDDELQSKVGKMLGEDDYNVLLTRAARVLKPDGTPLAVYLPAAIPVDQAAAAIPILSELSRSAITTNRGLAAGSVRVATHGGRTDAKRVHSILAGAFDKQGPRRYCRLTAWSGRETEKWSTVHPMLQTISSLLREHVPDRYRAQADRVAATNPAWVIPGTVFTTVTVNNTYSTGVHTDKGDLDEGFSTIVCLRRGAPFSGGHLVFPRYRVAVTMGHRDLLLMDAHEFHGNTELDPRPRYNVQGTRLDKSPDGGWAFERISVVSYYRTKMAECGDPASEAEAALAYAEARSTSALTGGDE